MKIGISLEVDAKDKNLLKKELDTLKKELEKKMKITMSTENKKTLDTEKLIAQAKERTAQASQKQYDLNRKQASDLTKKSIQEKEALRRQEQQLEIMKKQAQIKIENITGGKYSKYADTSAISNLQSQIGSATVSDDGLSKMKLYNQELANVAHNAKQASIGQTTFFDNFKHNTEKYVQFFAVTTVITALIGAAHSGLTAIFELDKAITELKKTTTATNEEIANFVTSSYDIADALATTNVEVIKTTAIFSKMGYELDQAIQLGGLATKLQTVGDGMGDVEDTANSLVAILKGFGVGEDSAVGESTKRVDQLNEVSNQFAVSTGDLTSTLKRISAAMAVTGNSFEQTTALATAGIEVTQSWETVSRALNTTSQRVFSQGADALAQFGIETTNANGTLRSTYEILDDLHKIYPTLTETQQQWILSTIAGKEHFKSISAIMQNWGSVQEAMNVQLNASGSATEELNRKLDSLEGRVNKMINSFNRFWQSAINSNFVKAVISGITEIVDIITTLNNAFNGLFVPTTILIGLLMKFKDVGIAKAFLEAIPAILGFSSAEAMTTATTTALNISLNTLKITMGVIGVALIALSAIYNAYEGAVQKAKEESEKFKYAQEELNKTLNAGDEGTKATADELEALSKRYDELTEKVSKLRAETIKDGKGANLSEYKKASEDLKAVNDRFKELGTSAQEASKKIEQANRAIENTKRQSNVVTEAIDHARNRINGLVESYDLLDTAMLQLEEQGYVEQDVIDGISEKYGNFIDVTDLSAEAIKKFTVDKKNSIIAQIKSEIKLTEETIQNVRVRIKALQLEVKAYQDLYKSQQASGFEPTLSKDYVPSLGLSKSLDAELNALEVKKNSLGNALLEIENVSSSKRDTDNDKSSSTKAEIDLLTALEKQLLANNHALNIQKSITSSLNEGSKERLDSIKKEIDLYKARQELVHQQANAVRGEIATIKAKKALTDEDKKKLEELQSQVYSLGEEWWSLAGNIKSANQTIIDSNAKLAEEANKKLEETTKANIKSVEELRDVIRQMVEDGLKQQIELNKKAIEDGKEQLDLKLKELEAEKELLDFTKSRADKEKDINKINSKIVSLQTASDQGDMKARAELLKLQEEKADKQEEYDKMINDRSYEMTKDRLNAEYEKFKDTKEDEIDKIEANLKDAEFMVKATNNKLNDYLTNSTSTLFSELINWNKQYGTGMDADIIAKWEKAIGLLKEYNAELSQSGSKQSATFEGYSQEQNKESIIAQMKANGAQWATASPERRKELNEKNIELARSIGYGYNASSGKYYNNQGELLYGSETSKLSSGMLSGSSISNLPKMSQMSMSNLQSFMPNLMSNMPTPTFNQSNSAPIVNMTINGTPTDQNINRISNTITNTIQNTMDSWRTRGMKPDTRIR